MWNKLLFAYANHARICSWNQPVLSNKSKVSCSRKQRGPLKGLEHTIDRYQPTKSQTRYPLRHAAICLRFADNKQLIKARFILKGNCGEMNTRYPMSMPVIQSQSLFLAEQMSIDLLQAIALWVFKWMISALIIFFDQLEEPKPTSRNGLLLYLLSEQLIACFSYVVVIWVPIYNIFITDKCSHSIQ